ncbi:hypothetical protein C8R45DRAFT_941285 [Mycena sanguinolenta]|nr:hypothetical protein C8R45DRAFT_941285 [Mycena sanguinolenta]
MIKLEIQTPEIWYPRQEGTEERQISAVEYILALTVASQKQPDRYRIECAAYASEAEELGVVGFDITEDELPELHGKNVSWRDMSLGSISPPELRHGSPGQVVVFERREELKIPSRKPHLAASAKMFSRLTFQNHSTDLLALVISAYNNSGIRLLQPRVAEMSSSSQTGPKKVQSEQSSSQTHAIGVAQMAGTAGYTIAAKKPAHYALWIPEMCRTSVRAWYNSNKCAEAVPNFRTSAVHSVRCAVALRVASREFDSGVRAALERFLSSDPAETLRKGLRQRVTYEIFSNSIYPRVLISSSTSDVLCELKVGTWENAPLNM